jgi:hypothetical protein
MPRETHNWFRMPVCNEIVGNATAGPSLYWFACRENLKMLGLPVLCGQCEGAFTSPVAERESRNLRNAFSVFA